MIKYICLFLIVSYFVVLYKQKKSKKNEKFDSLLINKISINWDDNYCSPLICIYDENWVNMGNDSCTQSNEQIGSNEDKNGNLTPLYAYYQKLRKNLVSGNSKCASYIESTGPKCIPEDCKDIQYGSEKCWPIQGSTSGIKNKQVTNFTPAKYGGYCSVQIGDWHETGENCTVNPSELICTHDNNFRNDPGLETCKYNPNSLESQELSNGIYTTWTREFYDDIIKVQFKDGTLLDDDRTRIKNNNNYGCPKQIKEVVCNPENCNYTISTGNCNSNSTTSITGKGDLTQIVTITKEEKYGGTCPYTNNQQVKTPNGCTIATSGCVFSDNWSDSGNCTLSSSDNKWYKTQKQTKISGPSTCIEPKHNVICLPENCKYDIKYETRQCFAPNGQTGDEFYQVTITDEAKYGGSCENIQRPYLGTNSNNIGFLTKPNACYTPDPNSDDIYFFD